MVRDQEKRDVHVGGSLPDIIDDKAEIYNPSSPKVYLEINYRKLSGVWH